MPKIATNFEVGSAQPIDTRFVVQSESDLANLKVYEGLEVYIKDLKEKRLYNGTDWVEVTGGASVEDVMNIIEENGAEVEQDYSIGTSSNYDTTSDTQIVTTKAVKSIVDAINTLKNYYNKTEVNDLINTIPTMNLLVVSALPTTDINTNTIYLVPYENEYEEYVYINNRWEMLGTTKINISEYATKAYVDSAVDSKIESSITSALEGDY